MQPLSFRQTLPDQFHVPLRGGDATLRFLLEGMQHVNAFRKTDRVHGPARVSAMVRNDLDDGASAKPAHGLRRRIGFTLLRSVESSADVAADLIGENSARKFAQVSSTRAHTTGRSATTMIHIYVYTYSPSSILWAWRFAVDFLPRRPPKEVRNSLVTSDLAHSPRFAPSLSQQRSDIQQ